ncbi:hypothetical protein I9W82_000712 [Candida metapsilosis]|uniref:Uncharacterized protein n=1 Tax=Candida metapsilosis TaxID=273372 RepID=A0A8H7ZKG3_9ASCO|nr:hypothetical protein I9W82_000712 [Candida metapsilosis]
MTGSDTALLILLIVTLSLTVFTLLMVTSLTDPYWYLHILSIKPGNRKRFHTHSTRARNSDLEQQFPSNPPHSGSHHSISNGSNVALDSYPMGSSISDRNNNAHQTNSNEQHESTQEVPDSAEDLVLSGEEQVDIPQSTAVRDIPGTRDEPSESLGEFGSAHERFAVPHEPQNLDIDSAINLSRFEIVGDSTDAVGIGGNNDEEEEEEEEAPADNEDEIDVENPTIIAQPVSSLSLFDSPPLVQPTAETPIVTGSEFKNNKDGARGKAILGIREMLSHNHIRVGHLVIVTRPFVGTRESDFPLLEPGDVIQIEKFYIRKPSANEVDETEREPERTDGVIDLANLSERSSEDTSTDDSLPEGPLDDSNAQELFLLETEDFYKEIYCKGKLLKTYFGISSENELFSKERGDHPLKVNGSIKDFPLEAVMLLRVFLHRVSE